MAGVRQAVVRALVSPPAHFELVSAYKPRLASSLGLARKDVRTAADGARLQLHQASDHLAVKMLDRFAAAVLHDAAPRCDFHDGRAAELPSMLAAGACSMGSLSAAFSARCAAYGG